MKSRDIVILSTADWDNPFWTNKQHVAAEMARLGHRVIYIDSLGLRRPSATARDIKRIYRRALKGLRSPRPVRENLWVWSPIVLPFPNSFLIRKLNKWMLQAGLKFWLRTLRMRRDILWTYNPLTVEFLDLSSFDYCVYHCVDEIKAQPGMPVDILSKADEALSRAVDIIFATSPALAASRLRSNVNTHYLPNVADFQHFSKALEHDLQIPKDLADIPSPRLGFIGAISGYKIDLELVCAIAKQRPDWSVILIGSVGEGDPWTNAEPLSAFKNIHLLGPRSYKDLPAYLKGFDIALLPNRLNEYTKSMFPMKFFEYLAAGKSIVSVDLDAIKEFSDIVWIAKDHEGFIQGIENVLDGKVSSLESRLSVARQYTYEARTAKMFNFIQPEIMST